MKIEDMPINAPRNVDLIPLMYFQQILDGDRILYCGKAVTSTQIAPSKTSSKKIGDFTISVTPSNRNTSTIAFGNIENPMDLNASQRDISKEIQEIAGETRITLHERGTIHSVGDLEKEPFFDGIDNFIQYEKYSSDQTRSIGKKLNVHVTSLIRRIRNELAAKGIVNFPKDLCNRSVLTTSFVTDNIHQGKKSWRRYVENEFYLLELLRYMRKKPTSKFPLRKILWHQDTLIPKPFDIPLNGIKANAQLYRLEDRDINTIL